MQGLRAPPRHTPHYHLTNCFVDDQFEEDEESANREDVAAVPVLVLTFPTPEPPRIPPAGDMPRYTAHPSPMPMPMTAPISALIGEDAQQGARSFGIDHIDGLDITHAHDSGTGYPFLEGDTVTKGYSSKVMVRVRRKVARLFSIGLRREVRVDGMARDLSREHCGRRRADGSFSLGRGKLWFKVSSSSTRVREQKALLNQ